MLTQPIDTGSQTRQQHFERVLSSDAFKGLKAILDALTSDREAQFLGVNGTNTYEELLVRLGYRITLIRQVHVQDAYTRVGAAGGIRAVLTYHDIPTQSSLPTLVNFDSTVTTTPKAASFFNQALAELKTQLSAQKQKSV
jgi:hypothetical protein